MKPPFTKGERGATFLDMAVCLVILMFLGLGLRFVNDKLVGTVEWESQRHHSTVGLYTMASHEQNHFQNWFQKEGGGPLVIPHKPTTRADDTALNAKHEVENRYTKHTLARRETQYDPQDLPPVANDPHLPAVYKTGATPHSLGTAPRFDAPPFPHHGKEFLEALMADAHGAQAAACIAEAGARGSGAASAILMAKAKLMMELYQKPGHLCPTTMALAQGIHTLARTTTPMAILALNRRYGAPPSLKGVPNGPPHRPLDALKKGLQTFDINKSISVPPMNSQKPRPLQVDEHLDM